MEIQLNAASDDEDMEVSIPEEDRAPAFMIRRSSNRSPSALSPRNNNDSHVVQSTSHRLSLLMNAASPISDGQNDTEEDVIIRKTSNDDVNGEVLQQLSIPNSLQSLVSDTNNGNRQQMNDEEYHISQTNSPKEIPTSVSVVNDTTVVFTMNDKDSTSTLLHSLQEKFQAAIDKKRHLELGPARKRQKKSKNHRKNRSTIPDMECKQQLEEYFIQLQVLMNRYCSDGQIMETEIINLCLTLLEYIDKQERIMQNKEDTELQDSSLSAFDYKSLATAAQSNSICKRFVDIIIQAHLQVSSEVQMKLLKQILEWCLHDQTATDSAENMSADPTKLNETRTKFLWVFVALAENDSQLLMPFLLHQVIFTLCNDGNNQKQVLSLLEAITLESPTSLIDSISSVLTNLTGNKTSLDTVQGSFNLAHIQDGGQAAICTMLDLAIESKVLMKILDSFFPTLITANVVKEIWNQLDATMKDIDVTNDPISEKLIRLIIIQQQYLKNSAIYILLLLQTLLSDPTTPSALRISVHNFDDKLWRRIDATNEESDESSAETPNFLLHLSASLGYICRTTLKLKQSHQLDNSSTNQQGGLSINWSQWLLSLSRIDSKVDLIKCLYRESLIMFELENHNLEQQLSKSSVHAICEIFTTLISSQPAIFPSIMTDLTRSCNPALPQIELLHTLCIMKELVQLGNKFPNNSVLSPVKDEEDVNLVKSNVSSDIDLSTYIYWQSTIGMNCWNSLIDLTTCQHDAVCSRATQLISFIPFPSLEDPVWQYQCLSKLTHAFFNTLNEYRKHSASSKSDSYKSIRQRLCTFQSIITQLVGVNGGVANYSASVKSVFFSIWLDAMFDESGPTCLDIERDTGSNSGESVSSKAIHIRYERTISSKCTITKKNWRENGNLWLEDSVWESELDSTRNCGIHAVDILVQMISPTSFQENIPKNSQAAEPHDDVNDVRNAESAQSIDVLLTLMLERVIPASGVPSDESYKEFLPNRSKFELDSRVEQWLIQYPWMQYLLIRLVSVLTTFPTQLARLIPLFKSTLVVLIGHWNSVKGDLTHENIDIPPYMRNAHQIVVTSSLLRILQATEWLPKALVNTSELLPLITPSDIRSILLSCWFYLVEALPKRLQLTPSGTPTTQSSDRPLQEYLIPVRRAVLGNIRKVGRNYPQFMI